MGDTMMARIRKRRALSPVIATIILSAVVIAIGGGIWSYASGASTVIANNYIDGVLELMEETAERFTVELVTNNSDCTELYVWIYNYGDYNVSADVYVNNGTYQFTLASSPLLIPVGESVYANVTLSASSGESLAVKVHSRRSNNAYYTYIVP